MSLFFLKKKLKVISIFVLVLWVSIKLLWWWWWMVMRKIIKLLWSNTNDDDDEAGILVSDTGNTGLMYCSPEGECVIPTTYTSDEKHDDSQWWWWWKLKNSNSKNDNNSDYSSSCQLQFKLQSHNSDHSNSHSIIVTIVKVITIAITEIVAREGFDSYSSKFLNFKFNNSNNNSNNSDSWFLTEYSSKLFNFKFNNSNSKNNNNSDSWCLTVTPRTPNFNFKFPTSIPPHLISSRPHIQNLENPNFDHISLFLFYPKVSLLHLRDSRTKDQDCRTRIKEYFPSSCFLVTFIGVF